MCHCGNTGVEQTPSKSQHTKLTLEKKVLLPLLPGFELTTFWPRVWCFTDKLFSIWLWKYKNRKKKCSSKQSKWEKLNSWQWKIEKNEKKKKSKKTTTTTTFNIEKNTAVRRIPVAARFCTHSLFEYRRVWKKVNVICKNTYLLWFLRQRGSVNLSLEDLIIVIVYVREVTRTSTRMTFCDVYGL